MKPGKLWTWPAWALATCSALTVAHGTSAREGGGDTVLRMTSPSFEHEGEIPTKHTCEGTDVSPPLRWTGIPPEAKSLALVIDDPDAPDPRAPRMTWVHWIVYDLPPSLSGLPEGARDLPAGAREGRNDWKATGYRGPCPPSGRHRYFHKLFALDAVLSDLDAPDGAALERAMKGHVLSQATLIGTYAKSSYTRKKGEK